MYSAYHACAELNVDDIKKTLAKKESQFKNAYSKMCYLFGILHRHIPENIEPQQAIKEDTTAKELDKEMIPLTDEEQEFFNGLENYTHDSNVKTLASYVINMFCDDGSNTSFKNELLQQFDSYNNDSLEQFIEFICKINTLLITFHIK